MALEIERKFRILNFTPDFIPEEANAALIIQDYLQHEGPGERRVRKRVGKGGARFFYTEKLPTKDPATRIESEREIREEEYVKLLAEERNPELYTIEKTRYSFPVGDKKFELDVFHGGHEGLVMLEVELEHPGDEVRLPAGWDAFEVTSDPHYKNRALAEP